MIIAKIAVSAAIYAIDIPYRYAVSPNLTVQPGVRVMVPFGKGNRLTEGIVLSVETGDEAELKWVIQVLDEQPVLDARGLRLAAFLRERYFCTFYEAMRVILPTGLWFQIRDEYTLAEGKPWKGKTIRKDGVAELIGILEDLGGKGDHRTLLRFMPDDDRLMGALRYLEGKKWITCSSDFLRRVGDKTERMAVLAASAEEVLEYANRREKIAPAQCSALRMLCQIGTCSVKELCYYTGATSQTMKKLADLGYIALEEQPVLRCREIKPATISGPLVLNAGQTQAYEELRQKLTEEKPGVALLYGVTGSGKTSVYIKLIADALGMGKSAMLLVPEIALTPQLLSLMAAYFGQNVAILHSSLSVGERYDQWKRIRSGEARLVVGTRSAVFAPAENLGLIILDEEQEHSYKSETAPRYCAREVAMYRAGQLGAMVLLGSATPSVETMYRAKTGRYSLHRLSGRYNGMALPQVEIVDMKEELRMGNDTLLSYPLREALVETMAQEQQAVFFLNRRGNSRMLQCVSCGEVPRCPRCSVNLTYHSANHRLMCHYCGFSMPVSSKCPMCGGMLIPIGAGTQKIQQELESLYPGIRVARMDTDTVSATNTHEMILERFQKEKMHVLLGTQMVAKGLNLPEVTLVGVLDADLSLYVSSYRAAETTFNMLTQVVGRAGRGAVPGKALIQTMTPNHQVIHLAAQQDYDGFFNLEIAMRQVKGCPPFVDVYTITISGKDDGMTQRAAAKLRDSLHSALQTQPGLEHTMVLGPAPAPVPKVNYNYRYCLTLRGERSKALRQLIGYFLTVFSKDSANRQMSAFADVNGYD
ncbi:MAG: primosomal protein N' [Ruminococcaceae bacterium]|nr:primosomal protein N' [Oscillospiraceae bacterium]